MPAADSFINNAIGLSSPGTDYEPVTPSDANELARVTRGIIIGTEGVIRALTAEGNDRTSKILPAGWHPLRVKKIFSSGTTADEITAVY